MPVSRGKRDPGRARTRRRRLPIGAGDARPVFTGACVWSPRRKRPASLPFQADLPPGIDQKQINFHLQLGIQLNSKWWWGGRGWGCNVYYSSSGGRAWGNTRRDEIHVFVSLRLTHARVLRGWPGRRWWLLLSSASRGAVPSSPGAEF